VTGAPRARGAFGACILTETFHPVTGGGETQARALAEGLTAAGVAVHLVTRRSDPAFAPREKIGGVGVRRVAPAGRGHLRKWGLVLTAWVELVRLRQHYDVMLVCGFRVLGIPAMLVSLFSGKPCVLKADSQGELSGAFFDPGLARMKLRHDRFPVSLAVGLRNRLLRRAARFIAISTVIEQEYLAQGVPPGRIARIPNSVDATVFHPVAAGDKEALRDRLGIPRGRRVATFTGRLVTTKGLPSLLRAWQVVAAKQPDALLLLVGSGGLGIQNCEDALRAFVRRNGLGQCVLFTGAVDNVHEYLQASDLFVFPSEREAFGISIIEAMACGLPVVTTAVEGIRDVVRAETDAVVIPPADDGALAAAILRVLEGGDAIAGLAEAARQRAASEFASGNVVAAYRELLAGLVRG
jgi:glycosyltransferase involved in cell wall biosynthesis